MEAQETGHINPDYAETWQDARVQSRQLLLSPLILENTCVAEQDPLVKIAGKFSALKFHLSFYYFKMERMLMGCKC
jgi:hypothetical protein